MRNQDRINLAKKIVVAGDVTYIASAPPGSDEDSPVWQARKVDTTTNVIISWADGDDEFDNVATDLALLNYY